MRKLLALAIIGLAVACGGGSTPPPPTPAPVLALDVKFEQPDEQATILGATLLFDGKAVAQFQQSRPEVAVVFSKHLDGVAAGQHTVQVRIDAQAQTPTVYVSGGFATYAMKQLPLIETGGPLATGQAYSWQLALAAPP
ncbi:MAG TPA: hypothetical protein VN811_04510 [Thermoanaerobaculia bacterium]|nr:hypothetical protein [Thermoanaerobaculia bacterium]